MKIPLKNVQIQFLRFLKNLLVMHALKRLWTLPHELTQNKSESDSIKVNTNPRMMTFAAMYPVATQPWQTKLENALVDILAVAMELSRLRQGETMLR
jgi:hypothetical protein